MEESKKATINPKNRDDKCLQYVVTVALIHEEIRSKLEKISKIKSFIDKYSLKGINYPSGKDCSKSAKNNPIIAPHVLYAEKKKYILPTFQNTVKRAKIKIFC